MSSHPERQVPRAMAGGADHGSAPPATDWHLCAVLEISISASGWGETKISPGCYGTCRAVLQSVKAFGLLFSSDEFDLSDESDLYLVSFPCVVCQISSADSCTRLLFNAISAECSSWLLHLTEAQAPLATLYKCSLFILLSSRVLQLVYRLPQQ